MILGVFPVRVLKSDIKCSQQAETPDNQEGQRRSKDNSDEKKFARRELKVEDILYDLHGKNCRHHGGEQ